MSELHVIADERTTWRVYEADGPVPLSEHTNATEAESVALARAADCGVERVVIHDRYHRTHAAAAPLAGQPAHSPRARTRKPDAAGGKANQLARDSDRR